MMKCIRVPALLLQEHTTRVPAHSYHANTHRTVTLGIGTVLALTHTHTHNFRWPSPRLCPHKTRQQHGQPPHQLPSFVWHCPVSLTTPTPAATAAAAAAWLGIQKVGMMEQVVCTLPGPCPCKCSSPFSCGRCAMSWGMHCTMCCLSCQ